MITTQTKNNNIIINPFSENGPGKDPDSTKKRPGISFFVEKTSKFICERLCVTGFLAKSRRASSGSGYAILALDNDDLWWREMTGG